MTATAGVRVIGAAAALGCMAAFADQDGVSFWLPGQNGQLRGGRNRAWLVRPPAIFPRLGERERLEKFVIGGQLTAGVDATADLV